MDRQRGERWREREEIGEREVDGQREEREGGVGEKEEEEGERVGGRSEREWGRDKDGGKVVSGIVSTAGDSMQGGTTKLPVYGKWKGKLRVC